MFARVSRFEVPKEMLAKDISGVEATKKRIAVIPGSVGMYYLVGSPVHFPQRLQGR